MAALCFAALLGVAVFIAGYFLGRWSFQAPALDIPRMLEALPPAVRPMKAYTNGKRKPKAHDDEQAWRAEQNKRE